METKGETEIKAKKDRSSPYPSQPIDKAVESVTQLRNSLGTGPFNRELAAKALGYSGVSGTSSMVVAALVHYGLLDRRGDTYLVSELAEEIMTPRTEAEHQSSLIKAALHPKLFSSLIAKYQDKSVPTMLDSVLIRDYNINRRVAQSVKKNFIETMTSVGLLQNGVIQRPDKEDARELESTHLEEIPSSADYSNSAAPDTSALHGHSQKTVESIAQINISHGFSIAYTNGLPFDLMTDDKFTAALRSLKQAINKYYEPKTMGKATNEE